MSAADTVVTVHIEEISMLPHRDEEPFKMAEAHATDDAFIETVAVVAVMPSRRMTVLECAGLDCGLCKAGRPVAALAWSTEPFGVSRLSSRDLARELIAEAVKHLKERKESSK